MPGDRIVVDGLWRCLCPSIDLVSLSKPFDLWRSPRGQPRLRLAHRSRSEYPHQPCRRPYGHAALLGHRAQPAIQPNDEAEKSRVDYLKRLARRSPWVPGAFFQGLDSFNAKLDKMPTRTIYAALKELQDVEKTYFPITRLVEYLVKERGERPNAVLYESLIKANTDKQHGSAKAAAQILQEIQSHHIVTTPEIYWALLEVTAVHPDYVLRAQVLHDMKNRWYSLAPSAEISIIVGLLRDGQHELALSKLEELNKTPINVPPWLFDVFLYTFGELGFHDETLSILKHRQKVVGAMKRAPLSSNAWQFLLDVFSRDAFQPGITYVWGHAVTPGHINPSDGMLLNVLNAASMHGDTAMAMSAIRKLSTRGMKLSMHHYEALILVHVQQNDLQKALTVLCIMAKAGLSPDLASTRPLFQMLRNSPSSTDQALRVLHNLKLQYIVPAAAFNVVLESAAAHQGFKVAFDLYRTIRQVCIDGPDLETFDILLRHCTQKKSMGFLVAEMEAFSLKPSKRILDQLVRVSSMQDDYESAFRYLEMMRTTRHPSSSETWWMSKSSALALLRRCVQNRDQRFGNLLAECQRRRLFHEDDVKSLVTVGVRDVGEPQSRRQSHPYSFVGDEIESARHLTPSSMSG
ncbi:hypothetical protein F4802DRAFT_604272 [Xylaria palmicola]|nr:hypothetical protein F4802DRAFT_604272 [Xylaria palmicola]